MKYALGFLLLSTALGAKVQYHSASALVVTPCLPGWVRNASTGKCDDFDECVNRNHTCNNNPCKNTPGSYQCMCGKGYVGTLPACVDIDECKIGNHTCGKNKTDIQCQNTKGSFQCVCKGGWENLHYDGGQNKPACNNQNECSNSSFNTCHENATCFDTIGSYACTCNAGYRGNGTTCYDVNECDNNACHWKHGSVCNNTVGSYTCNCRAGFTDDNGTCSNVNECSNSTLNNCNSTASCIDTDGSFWCRCNTGYVGDGLQCVDDDECRVPNRCRHANPLADASMCNNTVGSFECVCKAGWLADANGTCGNINECANTSLNTCNPDAATCVDTQGSYFCQCKNGYKYNFTTHHCDDVNECNTTLHGCFGQGQGCNNTNGSSICVCADGYVAGANTSNWTNSSLFCGNVDECTLGTHNCHAQGACTDAFGSFSCACNNGYIGDGVNCEAYDACLFKHDDCDQNAACNPNNGSFLCTCNAGWQGNGTNCTDVDECMILSNGTALGNGTDTCNNVTGMCTNTLGSFVCNCNDGYLGNGIDCLNIDECEAQIFVCGGNTSCVDTAGSYTCQPNAGYKYINITYTNHAPTMSMLSIESHSESNAEFRVVTIQKSVDIDECADNAAQIRANSSHPTLCSASATCNNTLGSYKCLCKAGYAPRGDGTNCDDVDECKLGKNKCSPFAYCNNTVGNYTCLCKPGYNGTGYQCEDIDECAIAAANKTENRSMCLQGAYCNNTVGSYSCTCSPGYFGDGGVCINKDECGLRIHNCLADHLCTDTMGSFTCTCPTGNIDQDKKANGTKCLSNKTVAIGQIIKKELGWQTIFFESRFWITPIVIVQVPLAVPGRQVGARVRHVNANSFQVAVAFEGSSNATDDKAFGKWLNASLPPLSYIAAAPGNFSLPDGTIVNAGLKSSSGVNQRSSPCAPAEQRYWDTATFTKNFSTNPFIITGLQSVRDRPDFQGGAMASYCESAQRFEAAKNNTLMVARICNAESAGRYYGEELIGWIAIGQNDTNTTRNKTFDVILKKEGGRRTILYTMADTMNAPFTNASSTVPSSASLSFTQDVSYGATYETPLAFASKVTMDREVTGSFNLEAALSDKVIVRVNDDQCVLAQPRREFFTTFVASEEFSV